MFHAAIPSILLASALSGGAQAEPVPQAFELQPALLALDAFSLPRPHWRRLRGTIELDGARAFAVRAGEERIEVDLDGDGDLDLELHGRECVVSLRLDAPGGAREIYPVRLRVSPFDGLWEWAPAGAMRGRVLGTTLTVLDLSGNGRFDDFGVDALILGSSRQACFLSRVLSIDGEWYELDLTADGRLGELRPWSGATGVVDLVSEFEAQGRLDSAILRSGELAFEVARARGGVSIPAGIYEFAGGRVVAGSRSARIEAGTLNPVAVAPDRVRTLAWGGPLRASCEAFFKDDLLHVLIFTLRAEGRGGEHYVDFSPRHDPPTITIRDLASGRRLDRGIYLSDERGEWGAFLVEVGASDELHVDLVQTLPAFGRTRVEVIENAGWRRRDLGL